MRYSKTFQFDDIDLFKHQIIRWANDVEHMVWLDSNQHHFKHSDFDCILAVEKQSSITENHDTALQKFEEFQRKTSDWIFGYLTYDLKNGIENLDSNNYDGLQFPELFFFQPKKIFLFKGNRVTFSYLNIYAESIEADCQKIQKIPKKSTQNNPQTRTLEIKSRISKQIYLEKVEALLSHIQRGDVYEANFCQEFYAHGTLNPLEVFEKLQTISKPPFAVYLKNKDHYVLSASPERYIKKNGNVLISQPIKGTAKRSQSSEEDQRLKQALMTNPKEFSENVMIVDLVRNDLSRIANKGSVSVEELCQIYSFKQVHHLISTITAHINPEINLIDVLKATFPMGSMTGAPKVSAMKIIEQLESTKRGLYSGSVGYCTPEGDFDFNVVIRSILYNAQKKYISFSVGSAITSKSSPIEEYQECLIKAKALRYVLEN